MIYYSILLIIPDIFFNLALAIMGSLFLLLIGIIGFFLKAIKKDTNDTLKSIDSKVQELNRVITDFDKSLSIETNNFKNSVENFKADIKNNEMKHQKVDIELTLIKNDMKEFGNAISSIKTDVGIIKNELALSSE
jgi:peptidoglycan hydrolase CwlO-like protein